MNTTPYPCDRGIPNNVLARGYHKFVAVVAGEYPVCEYCGARPSAAVLGPVNTTP